jgi:CIC family chloride channel protein
MAGVLSGVMYCPLTAIFLIAEITNGYELFIPLMIVSSISYLIVKHFEPYSMETKHLALKGQIFTHKKEQNILSTITLEEMLDDTYMNISHHHVVRDMFKILNDTSKTVFAIHDDEHLFMGILELNDIKKLILREDIDVSAPISSIVKYPPEIIYYKDTMTDAMKKFDQTNTWHLPVVNAENKFMGFISKSKLFDRYRKSLSENSDLYEDT